MKKNGFTLIELVVTLAIITVVSVVMFTSLFGWKSQADLVNVTKQAGALLREAASNAMTQEKGTAWGVHFDNATGTTPFYALFASSTYSTSSVVGSYNLPTSVGYLTSTLPVGSSKDIAFEHLSGDASASTSIGFYLLGDPTQSSTISVASTGAVSYLNPPPIATFAGGYLHYRTITIDHTKVSNTDQTNFPMLYSGTYSYLATVANGGDVSNDNGYDIIFTSDAAGQNVLPFEQESYNPATGAVSYWIQIPTLSHTQDTVIYMFYGNPSVTTRQANPTGVWDSNYADVWHFGEDSGMTLSAQDSTASGNNGTIIGATAVAGQIDGGANFNGSSQYVTINTSGSLTGSYTISTWAEPTSGGSSVGIFGSRSPSDESLDVKFSGTGVHGDIGDGSGWLSTNADASFSETLNTWYLITYVVTTNGYQIYENGSLVGSGAFSGTPLLYDANHILRFGWDGYPGEYFTGSIDEGRVSTVARSSGWIATSYNNESSPSTFYAVGSQTTP